MNQTAGLVGDAPRADPRPCDRGRAGRPDLDPRHAPDALRRTAAASPVQQQLHPLDSLPRSLAPEIHPRPSHPANREDVPRQPRRRRTLRLLPPHPRPRRAAATRRGPRPRPHRLERPTGGRAGTPRGRVRRARRAHPARARRASDPATFEQLVPKLGMPVAVQRRIAFKLAAGLEWTIEGYLDLETQWPDPGGELVSEVWNTRSRAATRSASSAPTATRRQACTSPAAGSSAQGFSGQLPRLSLSVTDVVDGALTHHPMPRCCRPRLDSGPQRAQHLRRAGGC